MASEPNTMLDRFCRRAEAAALDLAGCRRVQVYTEGPEWTIGHNDERVLLALGDAKPVELSADEADTLAAALALRAGKVADGT